MKKDCTEYFKEIITLALGRYNVYEAYDIDDSHYNVATYAEIKANVDFRKTFVKAEWIYENSKEVLLIYLRPSISNDISRLLVRQSRGYCNNEITDLKTYIERYFKNVRYIYDYTAQCYL